MIKRMSKSTEAARAVKAWEKFWGKQLPKGYIVHHKNGDPTDNSKGNLVAMTIAKHNTITKKGKTLKQQEHQTKNEPNVDYNTPTQRKWRK